jgi:hypothetical protein
LLILILKVLPELDEPSCETCLIKLKEVLALLGMTETREVSGDFPDLVSTLQSGDIERNPDGYDLTDEWH